MPLAAFRFFRRDHAWNTAVRNELLAMSLEGFDQARLLESLQVAMPMRTGGGSPLKVRQLSKSEFHASPPARMSPGTPKPGAAPGSSARCT